MYQRRTTLTANEPEKYEKLAGLLFVARAGKKLSLHECTGRDILYAPSQLANITYSDALKQGTANNGSLYRIISLREKSLFLSRTYNMNVPARQDEKTQYIHYTEALPQKPW